MQESKPIFIWVVDQLDSPTNTLANYNNHIIAAEGFELRFWDIRGLHKSWYRKNSHFKYTDEGINITMFHDYSDVIDSLKAIKKETPNIFFLMSGKMAFWNRGFIQLLEQNNITYGVRRNRTSYFDKANAKKSAKDSITSSSKKVINNIYSAIIEGGILGWGLKGPDFIFLGTKHDLTHINYPLKRCKIVYTHTKDYDLILTSKMDAKQESDCLVYVDQYLPYHLESIQFNIDPEKFYNKINQVLERISYLTNNDFIVTAHPSADPSVMAKHFPNHQVHFNKTLALVRNSDFAVTINSSAALGVLTLGKRLILMKSDFFPTIFNEITSDLSNLLGLSILDIDQELEKTHIDCCLQVDSKEFDDIFKNFIKQEGTPDKPEFEIICQELMHMLLNKG